MEEPHGERGCAVGVFAGDHVAPGVSTKTLDESAVEMEAMEVKNPELYLKELMHQQI